MSVRAKLYDCSGMTLPNGCASGSPPEAPKSPQNILEAEFWKCRNAARDAGLAALVAIASGDLASIASKSDEAQLAFGRLAGIARALLGS